MARLYTDEGFFYKETEMESLEWVNKEISSYKTSDYSWVRELTTLFEIYFDKEFRWFLTEHRAGGMTEAEFKEIFLYSLETLYSIINSNDYYVGDDEHSFGLYFFNLQHPTRNKELHLNKEKVEKLFIRVTMPFRIFEMNISKHLIKYYEAKVDNQKLDQEKRSLETEKARVEGNHETLEQNYNKLAEDIQEDKRKSIEGMVKSYINACEILETDDPKKPELAELSVVPERFWKSALANTAFLYALLLALESKKKQSKEKGEFWFGAYKRIEDRLSNAIYDAQKKKKAEYSSDVNYENPEAKSKQKKIKAEDIKTKKDGRKLSPYKIKECKTCGKEIKFGTECPDCKKEFKTIKNTSNSKKTKKEIETDERFKKTMEKLKAQKMNADS